MVIVTQIITNLLIVSKYHATAYKKHAVGKGDVDQMKTVMVSRDVSRDSHAFLLFLFFIILLSYNMSSNVTCNVTVTLFFLFYIYITILFHTVRSKRIVWYRKLDYIL